MHALSGRGRGFVDAVNLQVNQLTQRNNNAAASAGILITRNLTESIWNVILLLIAKFDVIAVLQL